jgi:hypothetical protein
MILTVEALAGEQGTFGRADGTPIQETAGTYSRAPLVILASLAAVLAVFGVAFVGWHLANGNATMALVSLLAAAAGIYLFLGILKELSSLEFLTTHAAKLSKPAREQLLARLIEANANSVFRLVDALLQTVERSLSGRPKRTIKKTAPRN